MSSSIAQNPTFSCPQLMMKHWHGLLKFGWKKHLVSDSNCNTFNLLPPNVLQGMTNNVGLAFSVGDTIPWFTISMEQDD